MWLQSRQQTPGNKCCAWDSNMTSVDSKWEGQQRMWWYEECTECTFSGTAYPTNTTMRKWTQEPTDMDFQVLMVTASGLIVRFLKVLENY